MSAATRGPGRDAPKPDAAALLALAQRAARAAGEVLVERFRGPREAVRSKSTPTDLVSAADLAAEQKIRALLAAERPDDAVLAEEGGGAAGVSGLRWVVDPLDGTVNFLFGVPHWCVSIACEDAGGTLAGVVLDPLRDECFVARRGHGATLVTGEAAAPAAPAALRGPPERDLEKALVATGFSYDAAVRERQGASAAAMLPRVRDLRRAGSAALDLAWTAAGRYDAYYEHGVYPWDVAAGLLLCQEAGLARRDLAPQDGLPGGVAVAREALVDRVAELATT